MHHIAPAELKEKIDRKDDFILLDVREIWEVEKAALPDSVHIPMGIVPLRLNELDRAKPIVVYCHHGSRSFQIGYFLEQQGFTDVMNLYGGIDAWAREGDPTVPVY